MRIMLGAKHYRPSWYRYVALASHFGNGCFAAKASATFSDVTCVGMYSR